MPKRTQLLFIWIVSFLFRVFFAVARPISDDVYRLYAQALDWFVDGKLSTVGAPVVYSGTWLPGSLQPILFGLPLWLSQGYLWGPALITAILTQLALVLVWHAYVSRFSEWPKVPLALLIAFNPWAFPSLEIWNPSFALLFSSVFFAAWIHPKLSKYRDLLSAYAIMSCLQLHLSFVVLVAAFFMGHYLKAFSAHRIHWRQLFLGGTLGSLTLIPWLLEALHGNAAFWLVSNIKFRPDAYEDLIKGTLRFLSFPSCDLFRFIGGGQGYLGAFTAASGLWLPIFLVAAFSALGLMALQIMGWAKIKKPHHWLMWVPLFTMVLFFFSIKGASAHTFWIILPWAFFPIGQFLHSKFAQKIAILNVIMGIVLMVRVLEVTPGRWFIQMELDHLKGNSEKIPEREMALYRRLESHP